MGHLEILVTEGSLPRTTVLIFGDLPEYLAWLARYRDEARVVGGAACEVSRRRHHHAPGQPCGDLCRSVATLDWWREADGLEGGIGARS